MNIALCHFFTAQVKMVDIRIQQHRSLEGNWLSIPGDYRSNPGGGEKFSLLVFELLSHVAVIVNMSIFYGIHGIHDWMSIEIVNMSLK